MLSMTEAKPSLLKISDKLSIRFQKTGSGPPLLLIHTIRTQLEYFRALAPLLARSHTVYAIDLPGHGHSPIDPSASFDEPYFRQAVIDFIEQLNLSGVTIVGEINASLENEMILGKIMGGGYHDPRKLPADLLAEFDDVAHRPGYKRIARKVLAGWRSWSKARDYYRQISAPVTLIYGDSDWSRPNERERTRSLIPAAQMVTLKNTGHFSAVENPSELARVILAAE